MSMLRMVTLLLILPTLVRCGVVQRSVVDDTTYSYDQTSAEIERAEGYLKDALTPISRYYHVVGHDQDLADEARFFKLYQQYSAKCALDFRIMVMPEVRTPEGYTAFNFDLRARVNNQPAEDVSLLGLRSVTRHLVPDEYSFRMRLPGNPQYARIEQLQSAVGSLVTSVMRQSSGCR